MLTLDQFDYHLPPTLIAQTPKEKRDHSRLLVVNRQHQKLEDFHFYDLPDLIDDNYLIVRNNTKVIPARIFGQKETGGHVELLLTKRVGSGANSEVWQCLSKPGIKPGQKIIFKNTDLTATCLAINNYTRDIKFNQSGEQLFDTLFQIGHTPIPPYIKWNEDDEDQLRQVYQTTYAKIQGSAAAPTAGLHFTKEIDQKLKDKGIEIIEVTLHVGLGTFLPVKDEDVLKHHMHSEKFILTKKAADKINQAKKQGKKILSIGTTTTRLLEACANDKGELTAQSGETDIYIYPGYQFKIVDSLITNFHLPKSTLLMLISALGSKPQTNDEFVDFQSSLLGKAYQHAIDQKYRFYSFGDAMLII